MTDATTRPVDGAAPSIPKYGWTLKRRLLLISVSIIVAMGLGSTASVLLLRSMTSDLDAANSEIVSQLQALDAIHAGAFEVQTAIREHLMSGQPSASRIESASRNLDEAIAAYLALGPREQDLDRRIEEGVSDLQSAAEEATTVVQQRLEADQIVQSVELLEKSETAFEILLEEAQIVMRFEMDQSLGEIRDLLLVRQLITIGVWVLTAIVVVTLFSVVLNRSILLPIHRLLTSAREIAAGDLEQTIDDSAVGEIGLLAQSLSQIVSSARELSQSQQQHGDELKRQAAQLSTAIAIGRAAASELELESLAARVVELACKRLDLYFVGLFVVDPNQQNVVLVAGSGDAGRMLKEQRYQEPFDRTSMVGAACSEREVQIDRKGDSVPLQRHNHLLPGTAAEAALPLLVGERILGALDCKSTRIDAFDDQEIEVLCLVADQVAVAIDSTQKLLDEATVLESTSPLFRVSQQLATAATADEVVHVALSLVAETDADGCALALLRYVAGGEIVNTVLAGQWDRRSTVRVSTDSRLPAGGFALPMDVASSHWALDDILDDSPTGRLGTGWMSEKVRQMLSSFGARAFVNVPLVTAGRVLGHVIVYHVMPGPFPASTIQFYEAMSNQVAVALERAQLLDDAERRAKDEAALRTHADNISQAMGTGAVLERATESFVQALQASGVYVELDSSE